MASSPRIHKSYTAGTHGQLHCRGVYPATASRAAIVCLHMCPKSGRLYHELLPHLARDRVAIAPDYPGHGESDLPPPEPHVTVEDYADAVWQVVDDRIGAEPVHLLGYHTGSMVGVEATLKRPERVRSLVTIGAPVFTTEELDAVVDLFKPIPIDEDGTRFQTMWSRVLHYRGPGMTLEMAATSMAENLRAGDAYEWGHEAAFAYAPRFADNLSRIEQPVLVMNPADDTYEQTLRIDPYLNNGRRVDYPNWGHGFLNAYPEASAEQVLAFLEQTERQ